jgi:hypothetical protein
MTSAVQPIQIPDDVREWIRAVFADCNNGVASKMSRVPTVHETSLDLTFIERLSGYAAPVRFESEWLVRIDAHYLGGGRHFGQWEVADIGLLIIFRRGLQILRTKVGLLQSKRLYPDEQGFDEDEAIDYMVGFARLMRIAEESFLKVTEPRTFTFSGQSRYKAFHVGDQQFEAIRAYETRYSIPVHYLFYHPLLLPFRQHVPMVAKTEVDGTCEVGCRVISASEVNASVGRFDVGYSPTYDDLRSIPSLATQGGIWPGWRLEDFVVERLMDCHEGHVAADQDDEGLFLVFNRRSGPISAAIAVTFEMPAG